MIEDIDIDIEGYIDHPDKFYGFEEIFRGCIKAGVELPEFIKTYINKIDLVTYNDNGDRKYETPESRLLEIAKKGKCGEALAYIRKAKTIGYSQLMDVGVLSKYESDYSFVLDLEKLSEVAGKTRFIKITVEKLDCDDD